ncbi:MAG: YihY/virulence factor BrkB family protein, partial [Paracoccus sp. (in: a-proteobacteria)]|nr:YihY/virulence factor BrkB family protein [Paracoccus sp. (in: a-proteobacteria)]
MIAKLRDFGSFWAAIFERMDKTHMTLIAAGVAFYAMFAAFPGIAAIISLWSLWFDPDVVLTYMEVANEFLPEGAAAIIDDYLMGLTEREQTTFGWTFFLSFMIATVAARAGVDALIRGLNAAYGVRAHSTIFGFFLAYGLTLVIVGISLAGLATIVIVPLVLNFFVFAPVRGILVTALPWAGMYVLVILTIGVLYRYGPNVSTPRTPIITVGALFAAFLWSAGSIAFSAYISSFNSYNRIYGSIGTV